MKGGGNVKGKKKPLQFHVPEEIHEKIESIAASKGITVTEFLRRSANIFIILSTYLDQGYHLVLRNDSNNDEKQILVA